MSKLSWFLSIVIAIVLASIAINWISYMTNPPPKCAVYFGSWQNYTYDIPCSEVYSFCERNGCEKSSGNCGRPICFCQNITETKTEYIYLEWQGFCDYCGGCFCLKGRSFFNETKREMYFQFEFSMHEEWENGDLLKVTWRFVPQVNDYRIRDVEKL